MNCVTRKRRNSNLHDNKHDEMNHKIRKCDTEVFDNSCHFNEIGIRNYEAGQYDDAKQSFVEALKIEKKKDRGNIFRPSSADALDNELPDSWFCEILSPRKGSPPEKLKVNSNRELEYDEGMNMYTNTLHTNESLPIDVSCATFLYNIGLVCVCNMDYEEAINWFESSLKQIDQCKHFSNNDSFLNLVKIHHNLGHCHYRLGKNESSMKHYKSALAQVGELCLDQRDLAAAYNCVGVMHFHTPSETINALELFQKSLLIYQQFSGEFSKEIGTLLNNIGRVHYVLSEYDKAQTIFSKALAIRCQMFARNSIDAEVTMLNTAQAFHKNGELDEAIRLYQKYIDLIRSRLGPNDLDTVAAYKGMGRIYLERNDIESALSMFVQALKSERVALGSSHAQLSSTLNEIGSLCYKMNDTDEALAYFQEGLKIQKNSLGLNKQNIIITLLNIAQIQRDKSNYTEALKAYNEAKMLQTEVHGACSLEVAATNVSLGLMQYQLTNYSSSLAFYKEALLAHREHHGNDFRSDMAVLLNFIGLAMYRLGQFDSSKQVFFDSIRIWQELGVPSRDVANLWSNVATVCMELDETERAIIFYWESFRIEENLLVNNKDLYLTLEQIGHVYQQCGEFDNALIFFAKALDMERNGESENPPTTAIKLLINIGIVCLMKGDIDKMMQHYVEATRLSISCQEVEQQFQPLGFAVHEFYVLGHLHPNCASAA